MKKSKRGPSIDELVDKLKKPEYRELREELEADRRKGLKDISEKPEAWQKHRAEAIEFCVSVFKAHQNRIPPIEVALSPEFSEHLKDANGANLVQVNEAGTLSALRSHWQLQQTLPKNRKNLLQRADVTNPEFRDFFNTPEHERLSRSKSRAGSVAYRNILIIALVKALVAQGWSRTRGQDMKIEGSAYDIVIKALSESGFGSISLSNMRHIWDDYQHHVKKNLAYMGTPLKHRKQGALHLIAHDPSK